MKQLVCAVLGMVIMVSAAAAGEVKTAIRRVVVYEDRAMVVREGTADLAAGAAELVVSGLPPILNDGSVRVKGTADGTVTVIGTEVRRSFLADPRRTEVEKLENRLEVLREKRREVDDGLASIALQRKFVSSISAATSEKISEEMLLTPPAPGQWGPVLDFIGERSLQLAASERKLNVDGRKIVEEIEAVEKELGEVKGWLSREAKEIVVSVEAAGTATLALEVSYTVPGAMWRPVYDARADHDGGTVEVVYRAEVRQKTGEDWAGVELALSTARPSIGGRPPELSPWYVSLHDPATAYDRGRSAAAPQRVMMKAMRADEMALAEEGREEALGFDEAAVAKAGTAVTFTVPRPQDVPSDASFHGMVVSRREVEAAFEYVAVPKLVEYPFLLATFTNAEEYPLLPGRINLFLGPDFVGTSRLDAVAPGQKAELYLGIDEDLTVKRELVAEKTEAGGLFRAKTGYRNFRYRIEVENFRTRSEKITVYDQYPVSTSPDLKVELEEVSPRPVEDKEKEQPGILIWKFDLGPSEKKTIEYEYILKYPKSKTLVGL